MLSILLASTMSAAACTVKTLRVTPTYTAYQETCIIQAQGQKAQRRVTTYRVNHPNRNSGSVPDNFVIPVSDR